MTFRILTAPSGKGGIEGFAAAGFDAVVVGVVTVLPRSCVGAVILASGKVYG